jgi:hypothetical protein
MTELEEQLQKYLAGDRSALNGHIDGLDDFEVTQRSHVSKKINPENYDDEETFVSDCASDLMVNGGHDRGRAEKACHALWAERDHGDNEVPIKAMTVGQRQAIHSQMSVDLDPVTQKRWNDWFDERFKQAIKPLAQHIGKKVGELIGENIKSTEAHNLLVEDLEKASDESIKAHNLIVKDVREICDELRDHTRSEIVEINKALETADKNLSKTLDSIRKLRNEMTSDVVRAHTQVADQIVKVHRDVHTVVRQEMRDFVAGQDKKFRAEVVEVHSKMITRLSDDLNIMRDDLLAVLRAELTDELLKMQSALKPKPVSKPAPKSKPKPASGKGKK